MSSRTPSKRSRNDENAFTPIRPPSATRDPFRTPLLPVRLTQPTYNSTPVNNSSFIDGFTPTPKRRRFARVIDPEELQRLRDERQRKDREDEEAVQQSQQLQTVNNVSTVLQAISSTGMTVHSFLLNFIASRDSYQASQASRLLINHGFELFEAARLREPNVAQDWALSTCRELIDLESEALAQHFRPRQGSSVTEILANFSVKGFLLSAEQLAPTTCQTLRQIGSTHLDGQSKYKDRELIVATTLCMLAKARNEHSTEFQTSMCMYFLACGTSRSLFNVLNHAGITLSYAQAVCKLKKLGKEQLNEMREIARSRAFMVAWDNLNIAFKVSEQRQDSKDHFDNGSTATLIPLYGVDYGGLPISLKPPRLRHVKTLDFKAEDLLPSREEAMRVQEGQLWHIKDILYDAFPDLRKRLSESILPPPSVKQIPLHKTKQYPLPAMHIDESTLAGTLDVLKTMFSKSLKLSSEEIEEHGIIICAGDQLSLSLLDKVSAIRRDDKSLADNVGRYTEPQDGLFHVKLAVTRMVVNQYWGKPNAKSPWGLWKVNTLLGRKAMSAGWKAKSLPPFRPSYELILNIALPANMLDGFRIYCPDDKLDTWVKKIKSVEEVDTVAKKILEGLCSGRNVERLRKERPSKRDIPFENICLFNRDSLHLRQLKHAIKRGDVGAVLDLVSHLMIAFRGTGQTPKYADALFHILVNLKLMDPVLREAWLMNWLVNLSGKADGFKEVDLMQEHQNFWLKIIYNAKGTNRSWDWLSMVSVSIFALRDVMRNVQREFSTPFNNTFHSSPSIEADIKIILDYLGRLCIQAYTPTRENNDDSEESSDLYKTGAEYSTKPTAFRNFTYTEYKTTNHGTPVDKDATPSPDDEETEDEEVDEDTTLEMDPCNHQVDLEDLMLDEEEFPPGAEGENYIEMIQEIVDEFSRAH